MHVTTNDAINAFSLLRDHVNENGFLYECYNIGIGALKTIMDGNYQLSAEDVSRETFERIAQYDCGVMQCADCNYYTDEYGCISHNCKVLLKRKEIEAWIIKNSKN